MLDDIYKSPLLKYPLTKEEESQLKKVWEFINAFKSDMTDTSEYRKHLIEKIRKKYDVDQFYELEKIANKMFWNLRWILFPLWAFPDMTIHEYYAFIGSGYGNHDIIPYYLLLSKRISYTDYASMQSRLKTSQTRSKNFQRSSINKLIIVDKDNNLIYMKEAEGSSDAYSKNYFNLLTMVIFYNRTLYEQIMTEPFLVRSMDIHIPEIYYQLDYGFPNINSMIYDIGKSRKIERIKKLYYSEHWDRYWFDVIQ